MKILVIEDDDIAQPLAEDLRHQYHVVDIAELKLQKNQAVILL